MRILVCGDREWVDCSLVRYILWRINEKITTKITIIEGEAEGADKCGKAAAKAFGFDLLKFPANWKRYGRAAGPIRNTEQLNEGKPELCLAFHDNYLKSKGTKDMVNKLVENGVPTALISHDPDDLFFFCWEGGLRPKEDIL